MTSWRRLARAPADPLRFLTELSREEGDVARIKLGPVEAWLLSHPEDVEQVLTDPSGRLSKGKGVEGPKRLLGEGLLTSEGEEHDCRRPLVELAFGPAVVERQGDKAREEAERTMSGWRPGQTIDAFEAMGTLALTIALRVILDETDPETRRIVGSAFAAFDQLRLPFVAPLARVPLPSNRRFDDAKGQVDATLQRLVAERRRQPRGDLLSILVGTEMPDVAVRDEVMNLFSGHKSVVLALTWALYLLAQHPEALAAASPRDVLAEAMRLYPPVWAVPRKVGVDGWTSTDGTTIRPGAMVVLSPWVTHRDGRFHDRPEDFEPNRFSAQPRHRYGYFPFGGGPRRCVGEPLAWLEGATVLATLTEQWRFRPDPAHKVELAPRVTLKPKRGVRLVLERRS